MPHNPKTIRTTLRRLAAAVLAGVVLCVVFLGIDHAAARPDPVGFDPVEAGRLESEMWRSYYEARWLELAFHTLSLSRGQIGFSVIDSTRLAGHAALSAMYFRKNTHDPRCLPHLVSYYEIIRRSVRPELDVPRAAALELAWWKERREKKSPGEYARTIAALTAMAYGIPLESAQSPALHRASAMAYRDAHRMSGMGRSEWDHTARLLGEAYRDLKNAVLAQVD